MSADDLGHLALAISMTIIAGYVDAVGFLTLGHFFVSFMSGNTTQFVVDVVHGKSSEAREAGGIILLYLLGVIGGHLLALRAKTWRRPAVLICEAALLGLAALIAPARAAVIPATLAMGLQNEALHKAGEVKTHLTYVTGTFVSFGEHLAGALAGSEPEKGWLWIPYFFLWAGIMVGAGIGVWLYSEQHVAALAWPAAAVLFLAIVTAGTAWHGRQRQTPKQDS